MPRARPDAYVPATWLQSAWYLVALYDTAFATGEGGPPPSYDVPAAIEPAIYAACCPPARLSCGEYPPLLISVSRSMMRLPAAAGERRTRASRCPAAPSSRAKVRSS